MKQTKSEETLNPHLHGYTQIAEAIKLLSAGDIKRVGDTFTYKSKNNITNENIHQTYLIIAKIAIQYNGRIMSAAFYPSAECSIRVSVPSDPKNIRQGLHVYQNQGIQ